MFGKSKKKGTPIGNVASEGRGGAVLRLNRPFERRGKRTAPFLGVVNLGTRVPPSLAALVLNIAFFQSWNISFVPFSSSPPASLISSRAPCAAPRCAAFASSSRAELWALLLDNEFGFLPFRFLFWSFTHSLSKAVAGRLSLFVQISLMGKHFRYLKFISCLKMTLGCGTPDLWESLLTKLPFCKKKNIALSSITSCSLP